jgi:predicted phosphodiesterase
MKAIKGLFLSDIHFPWNIKLDGVLDYVKDLNPDVVILGGDIIDADKTYGVDSWTMEKVEACGFPYYERDVKLMNSFLLEIEKRVAKTCKVVFLEGNHEERYQRMFVRYPKALAGKFKFERDAVPEGLKNRFTWIPYGDYDSFFRLGDAVFTHGTLFPDAHAKKMALAYLPSKTIYGHIHDFQAYTTHNGDPRKPGRYAVTTGCLCGRLPDYKKGSPNKWINGFTDFVCINGVVTTSSHIIENGVFSVGGKIYGSK